MMMLMCLQLKPVLVGVYICVQLALAVPAFQEFFLEYEGVVEEGGKLSSASGERLVKDVADALGCSVNGDAGGSSNSSSACWLNIREMLPQDSISKAAFDKMAIGLLAITYCLHRPSKGCRSDQFNETLFFHGEDHIHKSDLTTLVHSLFLSGGAQQNTIDSIIYEKTVNVSGEHIQKSTGLPLPSKNPRHKEGEVTETLSHTRPQIELCFSIDALLQSASIDDVEEHGIDRFQFASLAAKLLFYLVKGYKYKDGCELLPTRADLMADLFFEFARNKSVITETDFSGVLAELNLGNFSALGKIQAEHSESPDQTHHHSEMRKKRNAADQRNAAGRFHAQVQRCLTTEEILVIHGVHHHQSITRTQLLQMAPALIQQQVSRSCHTRSSSNSGEPPDHHGPEEMVDLSAVYGHGTLAITVVTLSSMGGLVIIPLVQSAVLSHLLTFLVAMGTASLVGDALVHLLPSVLADHAHATGESPDISQLRVQSFVWYMIACLAGIFVFYFLELLMALLKENTRGDNSDSTNCTQPGLSPSEGRSMEMTKLTGSDSSVSSGDDERDGTDEQSHSIENQTPVKTSGSRRVRFLGVLPQKVSLVVMILIGDSVHNFADGLAIGAAFRFGLVEGLALTVAVFCHELPHEFGDYAVLLTAGMNKWRALLLNFLSGMLGYLGLYIGIQVGEAEGRKCVLAITAGMFLYISLTNLFPELVSQVKKKRGSRTVTILLQVCGFAVGLGAMISLAIMEDYIRL